MATADLAAQVRASLFSGTQETYAEAVGTRALKKFLAQRKPRDGFAVLSDKAVYCKGRGYFHNNGRFTAATLNERVSLTEIEGVTVVHKRSTLLLTLCFFFLILAPAVLLLEIVAKISTQTIFNPVLDCAVCLLLAGASFLAYSARKKRLLELRTGGGGIALDTLGFTDAEEQRFLKKLKQLKKEEAQ